MSERCRKYDEQISAYLDGELSEAEASRLRAHTAACSDCAALLDLLSGLSQALRDDLAEPPAVLADGVMDRIFAWENDHPARETRPAPEPVPISSARKAQHMGRRFAVAACLILVIGAGAYYGMSRFWQETTARRMESVTLEAAAKAPEAAEKENEMALDGAVLFSVTNPDAAPQAAERSSVPAAPAPEPEDKPAEEAAEQYADEAAGPAAAAGGTTAFVQDTYAAARFTWDHPAHVADGEEAAFEALLHSSETPDDVDEAALTSVAAVEYNGVIYEFFLDEASGRLLWKDAAESVNPLPAAGTEDDLFAIIG